MLRRAVKNGFIAKYLLMDKWYFGKDLIKDVRRIKDGAIHVITLLKKKDTRFTVDGKLIPATSLKEPWLMKRRNMTSNASSDITNISKNDYRFLRFLSRKSQKPIYELFNIKIKS